MNYHPGQVPKRAPHRGHVQLSVLVPSHNQEANIAKRPCVGPVCGRMFVADWVGSNRTAEGSAYWWRRSASPLRILRAEP
jgi:hypothetical protein